MSELTVLRGEQTRAILQTLIQKRVPAIMSYSVGHKWHAAKVTLADLGASRVTVLISPSENPRPINVQPGQSVGMAVKHEYGKFIFETVVATLEPPAEGGTGGFIVLAIPEKMQIVQRRSYFRVSAPESMEVEVLFWHHGYTAGKDEVPPADHCCRGRLIDMSAGGAQVAVELNEKMDFKKGQYISMQFTPLPHETPLMFNAQIRSILPTADSTGMCFGLQMVGLEASSHGQEVLARLVGVVEQYYQLSRTEANKREFQTMAPDVNHGHA